MKILSAFFERNLAYEAENRFAAASKMKGSLLKLETE